MLLFGMESSKRTKHNMLASSIDDLQIGGLLTTTAVHIHIMKQELDKHKTCLSEFHVK